MLVVQLEPPHNQRSGDWFYRTHSPGLAVAEHPGVYVIDATNAHRAREDLLKEADVLILNMVCDPDLLPTIEERRSRGQVTVFEVNDDVGHVQECNPAAAFFAHPDHQILFRSLVRSCDAVQFSVPELARIFGRLNSEFRIFPNQLSRGPLPKPERSDSRVVVGWGGSIGHLEDMRAISDPLIEWVKSRQDVVLHLMCADRVFKLFEDLGADRKRHFPTGSIEDYYAFVSGLDIGVAPLEDTGFNRSRSDVKFLEYAIQGVAPVVQALTPYLDVVREGDTGLFFRGAHELVQILERLSTDGAERNHIAENAQRYAIEERSEASNSELRVAFYQSLLLARSRSADGAKLDASCARTHPTTEFDPEGRSLSKFETFAKLAGATRDGRHVQLDNTEFETLLHDALIVGQRLGRKADAVTMLDAASKLVPSASQPYLLSAAFAERPHERLEAALRRSPKSLAARVALGEALAKAGEFSAAIRTLFVAAEICPSYDLPYLRVAQLLEGQRKLAEAKGFYEIVVSLRQALLA